MSIHHSLDNTKKRNFKILALELQTKNAIEIMCWFQKSNIEDLLLEAGSGAVQQDYRAGRKKPEVRKNWNILGWNKFMVEKNDTYGARKCFFNLDLSYRRY